MAYNSYQPYQPYQQPAFPQQFQSQQQPTINSGIIWVQGEAGAKSYLVAPNTTVALWDSEEHVIYLKSADNLGMPTIKTLEYTIKGNTSLTSENGSNKDYLTRDDISFLEDKVEALEGKISRLTKKSKKEVDEDDE